MLNICYPFRKQGLNEVYFRFYFPTKLGKTEKNKYRMKYLLNGSSQDTKQAEILTSVQPNLKINVCSSLYIPLEKHSCEAFGQWNFETAEVLLCETEKLFELENQLQNKPIVLYVHGFAESANHQSARTIVDAYLQRGDHAVIVLDWRSVFRDAMYLSTMVKIPKVGELTANVIDLLFSGKKIKNLTLDKLHVVAHSIGCHLASFIAKNTSVGKIKRITALDPAGIVYNWLNPEVRLSLSDADFVDVIYTDKDKIGLAQPCGHANFYPNGGKRFQPGCPKCYSLRILNKLELCSHWKSWQYYAESVVSERVRFISCKASSWSAFKKGLIVESDLVPMGFHASEMASGDYFLQTNGNPPYGRGLQGLKYQK